MKDNMFGIPVFIRNKAPKLIFDRFLNECLKYNVIFEQ